MREDPLRSLSTTVRMTATGTLVGMQAIRPHAADADGADETGRPSDPFHPERWSNPPPMGVRPIIPCEEPEEISGVVLSPLQGFRYTPGEPELLILPMRRVTPAEERARLLRAALIATIAICAMIAAVVLFA